MDFYEDLNEGLDEVLNGIYDGVTKPDYLLHYTTQEAFQSIVAKGELWLSNIRNLNDPTEVTFGLDTIRRLMEGEGAGGSKIVEIIDNYKNRGLVEQYLEYHRPTYVMSFGTKEDSLPDWINYSENGNGICLKFNRHKLLPFINAFLSERPFELLLPVFYFDEGSTPDGAENKLLVEGLRHFAKRSADLVERNSDGEVGIIKALVFDALMVFSTLIKGRFHQSEKEWRLLIRLNGPGLSSCVDVVYSGSLKAIFKIAFPNEALYESGPEISTLGKVVETVRVGPRVSSSGVLHAIQTLVYRRWGEFRNIAVSAGKLRP